MNCFADWMSQRGWTPFDFQQQTWQAYAERRSGLLHAPTGMGKTYAVWGGPLVEYLNEVTNQAAAQRNPALNQAVAQRSEAAGSAGPPLRVLWITPLRALAADTARALALPLEQLGLPWTVGMRTGDTTAALRAQQRRHLPTTLITTPESLSLLLSYSGARDRFRHLRCVIVDEWHELIGAKRGIQTELCLAHLRSLAPGLRTWGMSATIGNTDEAMYTLLGPMQSPSAPMLIRGNDFKQIEVDVLRPDSIECFPWVGHLGLKLLPQMIQRIDAARSTLVFTNTRAQTEIWFRALMLARSDWIGQIAVHHGSLDRKLRNQVEDMLRSGALRAVVCTSSLDLGVDFAPVEQVIQVGSPKGIARLLQRAGRSGHQPGAVSRIIGLPTNALELVEYSAARDAVGARKVESRIPLKRPLDVLVQHLVTIALGDGFDEEDMRDEVRRTHAYAELTDQEWRWAMDFVTTGGPTLHAYPQYQRVMRQHDKRLTVTSQKLGRLHRMSVGTITSDGSLQVRFSGGKRLGTIEESFISRIRPGDRFVFAGRVLELKRVREMTAYVQTARTTRGTVPRWMGGRSPLSTQLAEAIRRKLDAARAGIYADDEMRLVQPLLELQARWSHIPASDELLIEIAQYRGGHHAFVFSFAGRLVHEGLAALVAHRITRDKPRTISLTATDYGFELHSPQPLDFDEASWRRYLSQSDLVDDLLSCVNSSQLTRRHFREIARIAGLVHPGYPGQGKSTRQLQASSELFYDVFTDFDPSNLLLDQARREVLDREMEIMRLRQTLQRLHDQRIIIVHTPRFTPLAFPLWAETIRSQQVSSERWQDRVQRMAMQLEKEAAKGVRRTKQDAEHRVRV